jgi:uncharacterized protein (DUF1697 family)
LESHVRRCTAGSGFARHERRENGDTVKTYIALLRGINVLGKGVLPMKELVAILGALGCRNVETYIQSGNAVFRHQATEASALAAKITARIAESRGFAPHVLVLEEKALARVVRENPFPEAVAEPKSLHAFFLDAKPAKARLTSLASLPSETERFELRGRVLYLHAPDGIGRSKLAANVERRLRVAATARNWRTVCRVLEMAMRYV